MNDTDTQENAVSNSWNREYHSKFGTNNKPTISHPNVFRKRATPPNQKLNSIFAIKAADK
jgi:hypothetical protein